MATTEIEKLERRYAENPQGLTFAPLAEVHRKNADIPRALELLKSGLELHPNYIPASIVLGRCHLDQGDLPAAEAAFSHVLRLDDENVIALKSLAEISERLGRTSEAQRWLKRLISIDRSNEEARQHLAQLEESKTEAAASAAVPPASPPSAAPPAAAVAPPPAVELPKEEPGIEEPAPLDLTATTADAAGTTASEDRDQASSSSPALEFVDTSAPPRRAEPVPQAVEPSSVRVEESNQSAPVDGLISQEFVPPKQGGYRLHPELTQEVGGAERAEQLQVDKASEVELQSSGAAEFRVPNAAEDFMESARASEPDPTIEAPPAPPPPSMLPAATPVAGRRSYSVRETRGQSVAAFFHAMLSARPPGSPAARTPAPEVQHDAGVPAVAVQDTRPAGDSSSPTVPPATSPAAAPPQDAVVSFDDFFGAAAGGSGASQGTEEAGKDDLDQFQSWLQNLKR